jgi:hypothetical protein
MAQHYFYLFDDGSTGWAYTDKQPVQSKPGHYVTYAEYAVVYAANQETAYQNTLSQMNADVARTEQVRDAYVSMGIAVETANTMSGYTGAVAARDQHIADHDTYVLVRPSASEVGA